jgi:hypothetical protein
MNLPRLLRLSALAATSSVLLFHAAGTAAQELKPGLWEVTTSMKMQGMAMPGAKFKHCLTAKDIADGKQHSMSDKDSKCAVSNMKGSASNYSFDLTCTSPDGKLTGSAKGSASATSYATEMKMRMSPDQGMGDMIQTMNGRLLGDCK